ncbi:MAG: hypothetical protein FWF25_03805 [Propionibacteriaceae bacterium]|nr:hypothetical protein [Propionibacteriaceae bacterium]
MDADVAEAERGYSLEFLRSRRRVCGQPLEIGDDAATALQFRLDPDRVVALDSLAKRDKESS